RICRRRATAGLRIGWRSASFRRAVRESSDFNPNRNCTGSRPDREHSTAATGGAARSARCVLALRLWPPGELEPLLQRGGTAYRRGHQEAVALGQDALHIIGIHVWVTNNDVVPLAGLDHPRHPFEHLGMLVLPWIAELLREIALANQDRADAGDLLQDGR